MALTDHIAASQIRQLRQERGMSPEDLAEDIALTSASADWGKRGSVNAWTIRQIEKGRVPGPRVAFVVAAYFGTVPHLLWQAQNARVAQPDRKKVAA